MCNQIQTYVSIFRNFCCMNEMYSAYKIKPQITLSCLYKPVFIYAKLLTIYLRYKVSGTPTYV